jgi:hypothetical protein
MTAQCDIDDHENEIRGPSPSSKGAVPLLAKCRVSWRRRTSADIRTEIHWAIVNRRGVSEVFAALNEPLKISRITVRRNW